MFRHLWICMLPCLIGCSSTESTDDAYLAKVEEVKPEALKATSSVKLPMKDSGVRLGAMDLPAIFEEEVSVESSAKASAESKAEAVKVMKMGEEKIKVLDENMGSVDPEYIKELRKQAR